MTRDTKLWEKQFLKGGLSALQTDNYTGRITALSECQLTELSQCLDEKTYTCSAAIGQKIERLFGVKLCKSRAIELLKELGFSYKKPQLAPSKINLEAQQKFVAHYKELKERLKESDSIHLNGRCTSSTQWPTYLWLDKEKQDQVPS